MERIGSRKFNTIGTNIRRVESIEKVKGTAKYFADLFFPNMLYVKILRSTVAHANIKRIDTGKAKALEGVKEVITYEDIPHHFTMHQYLHLPQVMWYDSYLLEKKVRQYGDRIAAVVAIDEETAEKALDLIEVEYEELPTVYDHDKAFLAGAPKIHEICQRGENKVKIKNNIIMEKEEEIGDVKKGYEEADYIFENTYKASRVNNGQIELSGAIALPNENGQIDVWATTQGVHPCRINIASSLGLSLSKINVHRVYLGGSFGAHIHTGWIEPIVVFLAIKTGQPVKGVLTREEMFYMCGRHPATFKLKTGVKKDGTLLAMEMDCTDGTGAYAYSGQSKMNLMTGFFLSMYKCPNKKYIGRTVYTNEPPRSAMRGAGNPQQNWAVETHMDEIANKLGIDPIEFKRKNVLKKGDKFFGQGTDVICNINTCGTDELFKIGAKKIGWKINKNKHKTSVPWIKRGFGVAYGFHTSGCGSEVPSKFIMDVSGATVKMTEDGKAIILNSVSEMGNGSLTVHSAIVAETLGLSYEDVIVIMGDTNTTPFDTVTHASRGTYGSGQAVQKAAKNVREQILKWASKLMKISKENLDIKYSKVFVKNKNSKSLIPSVPVKEIINYGQNNGWGTIISSATVRPTSCPPHFVVCFVDLEVNRRNGKVDLKKVVLGAEAGTIIYPKGFRGQIIGALHMGIGYALTEEVLIDQKKGKVLNSNFADYKIPISLDMPSEVEVFTVETYEKSGPFGAKGIGEGATSCIAAAIGNAICDAVEVRIRDLPISAEKILRALKKK